MNSEGQLPSRWVDRELQELGASSARATARTSPELKSVSVKTVSVEDRMEERTKAQIANIVEERPNGRASQWKSVPREERLNGRASQWKTVSVEERLYGRPSHATRA